MAILPINIYNQIQQSNDDLFGIDPVSLEEMVTPMIDELGHTFDITTINMLIKATPHGESILCPIGKEVMRIDQLIINRFAKEAIERVNRDKTKIASLEQRLQQNDFMHKELMSLMTKISNDNEVLKRDNQMFKNQNEKLQSDVDQLKYQQEQDARKLNVLSTDIRKFQKQITNLTTMSWQDKMLLALGPVVCYDHVDAVLNRGIPSNRRLAAPPQNQGLPQ